MVWEWSEKIKMRKIKTEKETVKVQFEKLKKYSPLLRRLLMGLVLFPPLVGLTSYDSARVNGRVIEKPKVVAKGATEIKKKTLLHKPSN